MFYYMYTYVHIYYIYYSRTISSITKVVQHRMGAP